MADDKKPGLIIALGAPKPKLKGKGDMPDEPDAEDGGDMDASEAAKSAMSDLIMAMHDKDVEGALSAYEDLCDAHEMSKGDDEEKY